MSEISYIMQSQVNGQVKDLESFLSDDHLRSVKDSPYTNIADQVRGKVFCIPFDKTSVNTLPNDKVIVDEGANSDVAYNRDGPTERDCIPSDGEVESGGESDDEFGAF